MTIHDLDAYMKSLPDWSMLDGCFGHTRIRPTDIDGLVERHGAFLMLEHKSTLDAQVKLAQDITFRAFARQGNTVIVFWTQDGDRNVHRLRVYGSAAEPVDYDHATLDDLRGWVAGWFDFVNDSEAA